jgi:hypothetical protein
MVVTNHERWGNLVKTWATGHNYLEDDNEYPVPETVDEFKNQLAKAQVFMTVPERFKQVKFVAQEYDRGTVTAEVRDRGFRRAAQQARCDLSVAAVLQTSV